jgi:hypothetical protein
MNSKSIFKFAAWGIILLAICFLLPGSPALSEGRRGGIQVQPEIQVQTDYGIDPAPTDASRAIDMAERVTTQNQQMTQVQLMHIEEKLDKLTDKINSLDQRLAGIERHLGIVPPSPPVPSSSPVPASKPSKPAK